MYQYSDTYGKLFIVPIKWTKDRDMEYIGYDKIEGMHIWKDGETFVATFGKE